MSDLIVLACASGKQCSHIIPLLYEEETSLSILRLVVNSKASLDRLTQRYPKTEVVQADFQNLQDCRKILDGATTIYYVSPTFTPHEAHMGMNVIDAAVAESRKKIPPSKFQHFVFSSVLHPEISKMLNHDRKRLVEEYLVESPLNYTILQPSHFTDNSIGQLLAQRDADAPVYMAPYDPAVKFSFTTLRDHAEASVKVIRERHRHYFATYQILSTRPMDYYEYVRSVGDVLGRTFEVRHMSYEQAVEALCKRLFSGAPSLADVDLRNRDGPERMLLYYNTRGLLGNPGVLEWLIGRKATSPADLARLLLSSAPAEKDKQSI
ncbi:uncharacterized protein Z519_12448 [Cladophialophora bantiana CBS 173.52]|uniref:NmrA-like domain-containing protein n=1 Tax=Cladophialophora bantiana (strain ATCC 10958 / CBS 173.52 / CDC B-1940 / NIH 8579) TaxID=1442370 RepID=A0A0D2H177_CLAB1|nr:uncharacterized protein Z519_12448 [Cladophialophora bantiana CBS 173.52]KIW86983.1 hypothetical protein Z519_12448 [Cladophialophora bantiana CBS 173.52]